MLYGRRNDRAHWTVILCIPAIGGGGIGGEIGAEPYLPGAVIKAADFNWVAIPRKTPGAAARIIGRARVVHGDPDAFRQRRRSDLVGRRKQGRLGCEFSASAERRRKQQRRKTVPPIHGDLLPRREALCAGWAAAT